MTAYPDSKCGGRRRKGSVSVGSEDQGLVDTDMDIRCSSGSGAEPYGRYALCGTTSGTVLSATMTRADCSRAASVCDFSLPRRSLASRPFVLETNHTLPSSTRSPAHLPENPMFATLLPTSQARTYDHPSPPSPLVITTTTYRTACVSMYARPFPSLALSLSTRSVVNVSVLRLLGLA